jgi:exopolysaccharide biosynthesis polyprenyl glycosylphosphotransferase
VQAVNQDVASGSGAEVALAERAAPPSPWSRGTRSTPGRPAWWRRHQVAAIYSDLVGVVLGAVLANTIDPPGRSTYVLGTSARLPYPAVTVIVALVWVLTLACSRVYSGRVFLAGNDEYRRILDATVRLVAVVGALAFFAHLNLSRSYVVIVAPVMLGWTLAVHYAARQHLHHRRAHGACLEQAVVVGSPRHVTDLVRHLRRVRYVGLDVVAACTGSGDESLDIDGTGVPVVAAPADLVDWIQGSPVRSVIVADATVLGQGAMRQFGWQLEGLGVDLIVAPSVTGVAGPRISVRPVEGMPLLHLEEPRFDGVTRVLKQCIERVFGLVALVLVSPVLLVAVALVAATTRGPIFYRAQRVGREGKPFDMLKLRTMVDGADGMRDGLAAGNEHGDDPLFKMRHDPRVTTVGRWLRRLSIDELPQLGHVVTGKMAIVGPRPPTPDEVARYTPDAWRRLMVRPGITGLWQVSGRSSLPWIETLRLDLYYVDNWSLALDLVIILKTFNAVLRGRGAY